MSIKTKNQKRGSARANEVAKLRKQLKFSSCTPLRERLLAIHNYLTHHPAASARLLCDAADVCQGTYRYFLATGATGNNGYEARRTDVTRELRALVANSNHAVGVGEATNELKKRGLSCCPATISGILQEFGIITTSRSVNAISRFLDENSGLPSPSGIVHF